MSIRSAILLTIAAIPVVFSHGQNRKGNRKPASEAAAETITAPQTMQSDGDHRHPTPRQECRFLIRDSRKRLWTLGIENDGDERLNATRQVPASGWRAISTPGLHGCSWTEV